MGRGKSNIFIPIPDPEFATVKIGDIILVREENVRDPSGDWKIEPLAEAMQGSTGAQERAHPRPKLIKRKDGLHILQGFRRISARKLLHEKFPNGYDGPDGLHKGTDTIDVEIYSDLSKAQEITLLLDGGNRLELTRDEIVRAAWRVIDGNPVATEHDVLMPIGTLLDHHFPPTRAIKDEKDYFNYRRGMIQQFMRAYALPDVVREAYLAKQKGLQNWPIDKEIQSLYDTFTMECEKDTSGSLNRRNPGKQFTKAWKHLVKARTGPKEEKESTTYTRKQLKTFSEDCESRVCKILLRAILKMPGYTDPKLLTAVDEVMRLSEKHVPDKHFEKIQSLVKEEEEAPSPEPETVESK